MFRISEFSVDRAFRFLATLVAALLLMQQTALALVIPPGLVPLNQTAVPEPPNLYQFVKNKSVAIKLGKALFWDMQVGSDGIVACASCHFAAGADDRRKNSVNPGLIGTPPDTTFQVRGPNEVLQSTDFPFHQRLAPVDFQRSPVLRDSNDIVGSQGVRLTDFIDIIPGFAAESGAPVADPVFQVNGVNTRQVTPRNAPSVINAIFNFTNFWDGRGSFSFNGVNPFGPADRDAGVWFNINGIPVKQPVAIELASLASVATGPPIDSIEMSYRGRTFPKIGKKLLRLVPLGKQLVHPRDSELGALSRAVLQTDGTISGAKGLNTSYEKMIQSAFADNLWSSLLPVTLPDGQYTQTEANFSLFFGLSIQLYLATLVSDQTPFDRFLGGDVAALTPQQQQGLDIFLGVGNCTVCHGGIELTNASTAAARFVNYGDNALIDLMPVAASTQKIYDSGIVNSAVCLITNDIGRGGTAPFVNPLTGSLYPLAFVSLAELQATGKLPFQSVLLPFFIPPTIPVNTAGAFKIPGLRNIELTAPYFHNGGVGTLEEVLEFYARGGNFPAANRLELDPAMVEIPSLQDPANRAAVAAFLRSLTDERVRNSEAPFDHPELLIPNGDPEVLIRLPAKDTTGVPAPPLPTVTLNRITTPTGATTQRIGGNREAGATVLVGVNGNLPFPAENLAETEWSAVISGLVPGTNTIEITATDVAGGVTAVPTVVVVTTPATGVTLTAGAPSPQPRGIQQVFVANGQGGTGSYEYRFWLRSTTGSWSAVRSYSPIPYWIWDTAGTAPGSYYVQVDVRSAGSVSPREAQANTTFRVAPPVPATGVTLAPSLTGPRPVGTAVTFTALPTGGSGANDYRFWVKNGATWSVARDYAATPSWTWNTAALPPGRYAVQVDVRSSGSTVRSDASTAVAYDLTSPTPTTVTLSSALPAPQPAGTQVTFTGAASGGSGAYDYRFWLKTGSTWAIVRDYAPSPTWVWDTTAATAGTYAVQVDVRSAGATIFREAAKAVSFVVQ